MRRGSGRPLLPHLEWASEKKGVFGDRLGAQRSPGEKATLREGGLHALGPSLLTSFLGAHCGGFGVTSC